MAFEFISQQKISSCLWKKIIQQPKKIQCKKKEKEPSCVLFV